MINLKYEDHVFKKADGKVYRLFEKTRNKKTLAIFLVIMDSFFFSLMSLFVRLSGNLPTIQKVFFRNVIAAIIALITLLLSEEKFKIKKGAFGNLLVRSVFGCIGLILNFWAIDHIGLADANILNKMSPFFSILASIPVLHEFPNAVEIITLVIAFVGTIFIVKPTMGIASIPAIAGLIGGLGAGIAYTFVRKLGKNGERGNIIVAFFSCFTCLLCFPELLINFAPMTKIQLGCLIGAGVSACVAQFSVTIAYKYAPAKEISVFDYSQVLFASVWGFIFFNEVPDFFSILGTVIIIAMAVFKWYYTIKYQND